MANESLIYTAGIVTAYGAAVRGGYTGTYEQFCADQAGFAEAAQQVREDKQAVEETVQEFTDETVPAAVQAVADEGTRQIGLVSEEGASQIESVQEEGADQIENVAAEGSTQVGNVNEAGATQVQAVEDKGEEVLESIPEDYSDLVDEVNTINSALSTLDAESLNADVTYYVSANPSAFSASSTYAKYAVVAYDGKVWECHTAVGTAGAWTGTDNWTEEGIPSNDAVNTGLTQSDPITLEKALALIPKNLNGHTATINFLSSFNRGSSASLYIQYYFGGTLVLNGNSFTVAFAGDRDRGIWIKDNEAQISLVNLTLRSTYRGRGLFAVRSAINLDSVSCFGGVAWQNPYSGTGASFAHCKVALGGSCEFFGTVGMVTIGSVITRLSRTMHNIAELTLTLRTDTSTQSALSNGCSLVMLGAVLVLPVGTKIETLHGGITNATAAT